MVYAARKLSVGHTEPPGISGGSRLVSWFYILSGLWYNGRKHILRRRSQF